MAKDDKTVLEEAEAAEERARRGLEEAKKAEDKARKRLEQSEKEAEKDLEKAQTAEKEAKTDLEEAQDTEEKESRYPSFGRNAVRWGGGIAAAAAAKLGFFNFGSVFILLALAVNGFIDSLYPFAGWNLVQFGSIGSFSEIFTLLGSLGGLYFAFKGPLFIIVFFISKFVLEKKGRDWRLLVSIFAVFYAISILPAVIQNYFQLARADFIVFIFLIFELFRGPSKQEFYSLTIFWILVYSLFQISAATGNTGALIHVTLISIFYLIQGAKYKNQNPRFRTSFIYVILFDFFGIGFLSLLPSTGVFTFVRVPILALGIAMIVQSYEPSIFSKIILMVMVVGSILLMGWGFGNMYFGDLPLENIEVEPGKKLDFFTAFNPFNWGRDWTQKQIDVATGTSKELDETSKKKLGVFFDDIDQNKDRVFYEKEKFFVSATLSARNFADEEKTKTMNVEVSCAVLKNGEKVKDGIIIPKSNFEISTGGSEGLRCEVDGEPKDEDPEGLPKDRYDIEFSATLNFNTQTSFKRYFFMKDVVDLLSKGEDRLNVLGSDQERNPKNPPIAAPIKISVAAGVPVLYELESESETLKPFGIIIQNNLQGLHSKQGKIAKIHDIQFHIPKGSSLQKEQCNLDMQLSGESGDLSLYTLTDEAKQSRSLEDITKSFNQVCSLVVQPSDANTLVPNNVEPTTRYFGVGILYDYLIKARVSVNLLEATQSENKVET